MLVTLHVVVCWLLIVVIMLQSGEAADLAGAFGGAGSQTAFGPRGAATFLSKATTWCAIMFMLTSMALTMHQNSTSASTGSSVLQQFSKTSKAPASAPVPRLLRLQLRPLRRQQSCSGSASAVEVSSVFRIFAAAVAARYKVFLHPSCGSGGTGRRTILRGWRRKAWGFESPLPHHTLASVLQ